MHKAVRNLIAIGLLTLGPAAHIAAADFVVTHHESLQTFEFVPAASGASDAQGKPGTPSVAALVFDALGRRYELALETNDRLLTPAVRERLAPGTGVYRGQIKGLANSWVRLVVADGIPRGVMWDGREMLALEAPGDSAVAASTPVIYRLRDAYVAPGTMSCAVAHAPASAAQTGAAQAYGKLIGELDAVAQAPGASTELDLGAVGDFELFERFGSNETLAETGIVNRLNIVDGIYSEQLGVQINVEELQVFTTADDPFTDEPEAGALLDELSAYRRDTPAQRAQGLTHLYTGRDLTDSTVGIAWQDALCRDFFGAGLSEGRRGPVIDSLIAAHEIGHNFGAEHDGEADSPCESTPETFIMAPSVNGSDEFSQCSIDTMMPRIVAASCIDPLPIVDMRMTVSDDPSPVLLGASASASFTASNAGAQPAANTGIVIALPDNVTAVSASTEFGSCSAGAGSVDCSYGSVPGGSARTVTLSFTAASVGSGDFVATVTADADVNANNDEVTVTLTVDPAVDLVVNAIAATQAMLNEAFPVMLELENRSILDASAVELSISLSNGLRADAASWPLGACTIAGQQVDCTAAAFAGQSGATLDLTLAATANGASSYTVMLSSPENDADAGNNNVTATVQVGPVNMSGGAGGDTSSGGGGGSNGPVWLLVLGLWAAIAPTRRAATSAD